MATFTRKKYLRLAAGFYGRARNCYRIMIPKVEKALQHAYRDRRRRRRDMRQQWVQTVGAGAREHGCSYSAFAGALRRSSLSLNRKVLAHLAVNEPLSFRAVLDEARLQAGVSAHYVADVEYVEALSRQYLVAGEARDELPPPPSTIEYAQVNPAAPLPAPVRFVYDPPARPFYARRPK